MDDVEETEQGDMYTACVTHGALDSRVSGTTEKQYSELCHLFIANAEGGTTCARVRSICCPFVRI